MRVFAVVLALAATPALPCSLSPQPVNPLPVGDGGIEALPDAGADAQAPSQLIIDSVTLMLFDGAPCDGSGSSCPQFDTLRVAITATDDRTPVADLRYAVAFGSTGSEAASATPSLLVEHDFTSPGTVSSYLGFNRARSGQGFARQNLCFTLSAVDAAANVGPRSAARCLDTTANAGATVFPGKGCSVVPQGCSTSSTWPALGLVLAGLSRRLRRRLKC
jgi:hypothetical protein